MNENKDKSLYTRKLWGTKLYFYGMKEKFKDYKGGKDKWKIQL